MVASLREDPTRRARELRQKILESLSAEELTSYANRVVEFGQTKDSLTVLGRFSDPADAAAAAQRHLDANSEDEPRERIVFDSVQASGDYCCANGWDRITEAL